MKKWSGAECGIWRGQRSAAQGKRAVLKESGLLQFDRIAAARSWFADV